MKYKVQREWLNITIDKKTPYKTLKEFFDYYHISKKNRREMMEKEEVMINHLVNTDENTPLDKGKQLRLKVFKKEEIDYKSQYLFDLAVMYEDEFCLIVDKPAGYIVHDERNSLANQVAYYYKEKGIHTPVRYIHRLDKETSGLVFFCKCPFFQPYFDDLLARKEISRRYMARVEGLIPWDNYTCDLPIGKDRHNNNKYITHPNGKPSTTHFEKYDYYDGHQTIVLCTLETGRTHQIRVHLSSLGFPIVNDAIYGKVTSDEDMALCAYELTWPHPVTGEYYTCTLVDYDDDTIYISDEEVEE